MCDKEIKLVSMLRKLLIISSMSLTLSSCGILEKTPLSENSNVSTKQVQGSINSLSSVKEDIPRKVIQTLHISNYHKQEIELLISLSSEGDIDASYQLAKAYINGHSVNIDYKLAFELLSYAASKNHSIAQLDLGYYYETGGIDLNINTQLAKYWYEESAEQKNLTAINNLGVFYANGIASDKNTNLAIELYSYAFSEGYIPAICNLGKLYRDLIKPNDVDAAVRLFEIGANFNETSCLFQLGYTFTTAKKNYAKAIYWYEKAAKNNDRDALSNLGLIYNNGDSGFHDPIKAMSYYQQAATLGSHTALVGLGTMFEHGEGVEVDYQRAKFYYEEAIDKGNVQAIHNLAYLYSEGNGVKQNKKMAIEKYRLAINKGNNPYSHFNLGRMYLNGQDLTQDFDLALMHFNSSFLAGYIPAVCAAGNVFQYSKGMIDFDKAISMYNIGADKNEKLCLLELGNLYSSKIINFEKAFTYYSKAAEQHSKEAYFNLGVMYQFGNKYIEKNSFVAKEMYEKAINLGDTISLSNIGYLYESGELGKVEYKIAYEYYLKGNEYNNPQSINNLATFYKDGIIVKKDINKAIKLYKKAAELGNDFANTNLGKLYLNGDGVRKNTALALKYFESASLLGSNNASYFAGEIYLKSEAVEKNIEKALHYMTLAYEQGNIEAPYFLGDFYKEGMHIKIDISKALFWYQKALDVGMLDSINPMAEIYWKGIGVPVDHDRAIALISHLATLQNYNIASFLGEHFYYGINIEQDYDKAKHYFTIAADKNDYIAINNLGSIYQKGQGVSIDLEKAEQFYLRSALIGLPDAMYNLSLLYKDRNDPNLAFYWMEKASESVDLPNAVYQLGLMYQDGYGTPQNNDSALKQFLKAADIGMYEAMYMAGKQLIDANNYELGISLLNKSAEYEYAPAIELLDRINLDQKTYN
jgi:TPR repeat protein